VDGTVDQVREQEAREIAALIRSAKEEAWQVTVDEQGKRRRRPANYSDIALLLPTRTPLPSIEDALEEAGIPYRVESRSLVYDTQEVRDLLAILRSIDDATDEVALISTLRSPAFACGDDDLFRYHDAGGRWDYRREAPNGLAPDDPVVAAMAALHDLHLRRWWLPISGVVEAVIRERRLFELAFAHQRPRERWQRLRFVLDQARAFTEIGGRTLRQFIDWAERQSQGGTRVVETVVPEPDDDAVRIMTVHAAKGLEFPIVILAGLNLEGGGHSQACVLWNDDNSPEAKLGSFATEGYPALEQREKDMEAFEDIRLLYVAATRARDHLVVSVHHKRSDKNRSHAAQILERSMTARHLWQAALVSPRLNLAPAADAPAFDDSPERREAWLAVRAHQLNQLSNVPAVAATSIASGVAGADDPNLRKESPVEEMPPWRRGRAGTALGRAVHAVLQSIDLATADGLEGAARAQAAAEGIADRAGEIARMVSTALASPWVRAAVASGRYWRELFLAAPIEGQTLEGFVDLLYEAPEGLVIVDYKTDELPDGLRLEEAMTRYRLQGAAYALALEAALGRHVARCVFLFVQPSTALGQAVADLPMAMADVRRTLQTI
jgi:ATP-dependent exoDNAse (exonuclease V) beta subunit